MPDDPTNLSGFNVVTALVQRDQLPFPQGVSVNREMLSRLPLALVWKVGRFLDNCKTLAAKGGVVRFIMRDVFPYNYWDIGQYDESVFIIHVFFFENSIHPGSGPNVLCLVRDVA